MHDTPPLRLSRQMKKLNGLISKSAAAKYKIEPLNYNLFKAWSRDCILKTVDSCYGVASKNIFPKKRIFSITWGWQHTVPKVSSKNLVEPLKPSGRFPFFLR
jgi:hypothetical protein